MKKGLIKQLGKASYHSSFSDSLFSTLSNKLSATKSELCDCFIICFGSR